MILKKKETLESSSNSTTSSPRDAREFATRMLMNGIMPLETVSRLTKLSMGAVQELAAKVALNSEGVHNMRARSIQDFL